MIAELLVPSSYQKKRIQQEEVSVMKSTGVTHHEFDFDGGSCLKLLERQGLIQECIFGEEELKNSLEEGGISKLIFVDASPKEPLSGIDVSVYDHHQKSDSEDQDKTTTNKTAFDIMIDAIGTCGLDSEKISTWRKLVMLGDKKAEADDMDIARALKKVHDLLDSDIKTYTKWFSPLFDSFFANKPDLERAIKILQEAISQFVLAQPESPARIFLQRWSERIQDKEKISRSTLRNLIHFLAYMEEDVAKEWVRMLLEGYHEDQVEFQECKNDFNKANVDFFGDTLIISGITKRAKFVQVARNKVFSKDQDVNPLIREKIKDRNSPWLVVLVNPQNKNFQILANGNKIIINKIIAELIKAIRAEVLLKRAKSMPGPMMLTKAGTIEDTDPLFFHKLETGYSSILWGSLKYPKEAAIEFGNTSAQIHSRLVEITKLALDKEQYAEGCNPDSCNVCPIFPWQLEKCESKRKLE